MCQFLDLNPFARVELEVFVNIVQPEEYIGRSIRHPACFPLPCSFLQIQQHTAINKTVIVARGLPQLP